jgi:ABC-type multidrug transport system fused ATPase/permease subunit
VKSEVEGVMRRAGDQSTQTRNEVFQVQQHMDAMQRMVRQCQGAWTSMRELFALLDKVVGDLLYLTGDKESESKAGKE